MNQLDFSFDRPAWERVLDNVPDGGSYCAATFITLMEDQPDGEAERALELLEQRDILLDFSRMPQDFGFGDAAIRLRREYELVKAGSLHTALEDNDPLRLYLEEIAQTPAVGDMQAMAQRYLSGEEAVLPLLTNGMLGRVVSHACAYTGRGVLLLDLIQEGSLALWQGILHYTGGDFVALCDRKIQCALAKSTVMQAMANGIGRNLQQALGDFQAMDTQLLGQLGRNPTLAEIADGLHMSLAQAEFVSQMLESAKMMAKTEPVQEDSDAEQAVEDTAYFQMRQRIQELLSVLPEQEAKLLTLRFGLEGGAPLTPEQAGKMLSLTPEEILKIEASALSKLRENR